MADREGVFRRRRTDGRRPHRTVIRHTDEEWARVQAMATVQGVSVPRLYERALLAGDVVVAAKLTTICHQMEGPRRVLAGVGSNLNQMTKVANATGDIEGPALEAAIEMLDRHMARMNEILSQLPGGEDL